MNFFFSIKYSQLLYEAGLYFKKTFTVYLKLNLTSILYFIGWSYHVAFFPSREHTELNLNGLSVIPALGPSIDIRPMPLHVWYFSPALLGLLSSAISHLSSKHRLEKPVTSCLLCSRYILFLDIESFLFAQVHPMTSKHTILPV